MIALVTGGSGCGKSTWAEKLAVRLGGSKCYIATMQVVDDECAQRVARHRAQREGLGFETIERPVDIGGAAVPKGATALLECLPTLLAGEMFGGDANRALPGILTLAERVKHLIVVTNDVFSDGLTYDPETRRYMERLAALNREIARRADLVAEVVYSVPVILKGECP